MIYIEKIPFRPGSDEWMKMALFMNARLLLIFEEELAYRGIDKLDSSLIEDEELFHKFSDYYTPMIFSYAKANQAVIATYLLIKEQGFYEGDIDVYYVLHMLMRSYRKRLREMMGNTVLKICDEERVEYEKLFEECKVKFTNNKDKGILDYLVEQRTAVINGAAGTGKTMIATEKARRHAAEGDSVLFLCYNVQLKEFLEKKYAYENVDYFTIAGLACHMCKTSSPDYKKLAEKIEEHFFKQSFPYTHIIIDEGQDTFCTRLCEADVNIKVIQSVMGHKDIQTTLDIYAEVSGTKSKKSLNDVFDQMKLF